MLKLRSLLLILVLAVLATSSFGQDAGQPRVNREQMWPAATAEEWKKPVLITFQRTWEDAVAVSKATGKPILICINMDGEIASEHYAGIRYRQPEICKLYEPYVCVIASTYRHNPRDYDDQGRRILCPRFGSVTCGEHIAIEPIVYEKYLDEKRIAPRHIMIELDGAETYDVYYANDTDSVFKAIEEGITAREAKPKNIVRGDRSIVERVASPDIVDRIAVEEAYQQGDADLRRKLLAAAREQGGQAPLDLLRLAVFGLDADLAKQARGALAKSESEGTTDLVADALRVPMEKTERDSLIAALNRLGANSPRARWLAVVHEGLLGESGSIDLDAWSKASREYVPSSMSKDITELEAKQREWGGTYSAKPLDAQASIELAEASLALALKARKDFEYGIQMAKAVSRHMFEDARIAADRAAKLDATPWRVNTVRALAAYYRGNTEAAYRFAADAVMELPPGEPSWNSMAVLTVFGEGRFKAIKAAAKAGEKWPPEYLTDLEAAYTALLHHPLSTDDQVLWHYDLLEWLGVKDRAQRVLESGLAKFPQSPKLHQRLRLSILRTKGVRAMQTVYENLIDIDEPDPNMVWYAGYASVVAADFYRRRGVAAAALQAYDRAIELYDLASAAVPAWKDAADRPVALAFAGKARLAYERGDDAAATADIITSFARSPGSVGTRDDLGITPAATAQMLMARLIELKEQDLIAALETAIGKLDPALLVPEEE